MLLVRATLSVQLCARGILRWVWIWEAASSPSKAVLCNAAARTPMAPACVKLWTRCLQDLQQLPALEIDPAALGLTTAKVHATLAQWRELPPLSARDWRKLVLEAKV